MPGYLAAQEMLRGQPNASLLMRRYRVGYVVVGPLERALGANLAYLRSQGRVVYDSEGYIVIKVTAGP